MCRFKCAIVLCDQSWQDPDLDQANGIEMRDETDMLRMDAIVTTIQLNIRCLLEVSFSCTRAQSAAVQLLREPSEQGMRDETDILRMGAILNNSAQDPLPAGGELVLLHSPVNCKSCLASKAGTMS